MNNEQCAAVDVPALTFPEPGPGQWVEAGELSRLRKWADGYSRARDALDHCGIAGIMDEFKDIADAIAQMATHIKALEAGHFAQTQRRLEAIAKLDHDWDSYGASAIDTRAIDCTRRLCAVLAHAPQLVPTSGGGIQLEWHRDGIEVEIVVPPEGATEFYLEGAPTTNQLLTSEKLVVDAAQDRPTVASLMSAELFSMCMQCDTKSRCTHVASCQLLDRDRRPPDEGAPRGAGRQTTSEFRGLSADEAAAIDAALRKGARPTGFTRDYGPPSEL